jgi:hypothetical protein
MRSYEDKAQCDIHLSPSPLLKHYPIAHHIMHQGRRARYKGLRKNQFDGRRHAEVSNLQVAAHYVEERQRAS